MGVKKIKSEYTEYFVSSKTKNKTFVYKTSLNNSFNYLTKISTKYENPITYCKRSKNNLILITKYFKRSGKFKTVKTTFKNYFKTANKISFYNFNSENEPIIQDATANLCANLKGNISDNNYNYILGSKKKDSYTLSNTSHIFDEKGNDIYIAQNNTQSEIHDFSGKDKYTFTNSTGNITDYKGKDIYTITASNAIIVDYSGNDKYYLKNNIESSNSPQSAKLTSISEYKGNDYYDMGLFDNLNLVDNSGKDQYIIRNSKLINITDKSGKDSYTVNNSNNVTLSDYFGNDNYEVKNLSYVVEINDYNGSNSYNFSNTSGITINDMGLTSKTTYTISNAIDNTYDNIINDFGGSDSYTISSSKNILINDYNIESDNYKLTSCTNFTVNDKGCSKDIYEISFGNGKIVDNGGADIYKISNLENKIEISDNGGFDSLNLINSDKNDFVYMAEIYKNGNVAGDIFIFNKQNNGHIRINNFLSCTNELEHNYIGLSNGATEKITIGYDDVTSNLTNYSNFNTLKANVISWLTDKNCESVSYAIENNMVDNTLITYFTNVN